MAWATNATELAPRSVLLTFDDGYADLGQTALPILEAVGYSAVVFVVTGHVGSTNAWDEALGGGGHELLDARAIRSWSRRGIEFGAHTRSHPDLSRLSLNDAQREVMGSKRDLEAIVEKPVPSFAYPYGSHDSTVRTVVASAFAIAFTVVEGRNSLPNDPHMLRRTMVQSVDTELDIALRVRFGRSHRRLARGHLGQARQRLRCVYRAKRWS
ncbi:MAG: polysaccharide deacetylase family protein [Solirubrobacteraceae bacterium]